MKKEVINMEFININLALQKNDIITSKKGILTNSPLTGKCFVVTKIKVLGKNAFVVVEPCKKEEVKMTKYFSDKKED